jgi:Rrf2 family protein
MIQTIDMPSNLMYTNSIEIVEIGTQSMLVTQKSRYGMRAVFELAKRFGEGQLKIGDIARAQAIPQRFLEGILRELKQASIVDSRRGSQGGYFLVHEPAELSVDDIIAVLQGPINPMECAPGEHSAESGCELYGHCVFLGLWQETRDAVRTVHKRTTFQSLVDKEHRLHCSLDYSI